MSCPTRFPVLHVGVALAAAWAIGAGGVPLGALPASADDDGPSVHVRISDEGQIAYRALAGTWSDLGRLGRMGTPERNAAVEALRALLVRMTVPNELRERDGTSKLRLAIEPGAKTTWDDVQEVVRVAGAAPMLVKRLRFVSPKGEAVGAIDQDPRPPSFAPPAPAIVLTLTRLDTEDAARARTEVRVGGLEWVVGPGEDRAKAYLDIRARVALGASGNAAVVAQVLAPPPSGGAVPYEDVFDAAAAARGGGVARVEIAGPDALPPEMLPNPVVGARPAHPVEDASPPELKWLAAHQSADGGWEAAGFPRWCDGKPSTGDVPDGAGRPENDVAVTGLALMAFLGAGYTNRGDHPFAKTVLNGFKKLKLAQEADGCFGRRAVVHPVLPAHPIATLAFLEAYGMTGSAIYKTTAQVALDYIAKTRTPGLAWGSKAGQNDTVVTGWMAMVLRTAEMINAAERRDGKDPSLRVDHDALLGARTWIERVTDPATGRVGNTSVDTRDPRPSDTDEARAPPNTETTTAIGVMTRLFAGEDPTSDAVRKGVAILVASPPRWDASAGSADFVYGYFATVALLATWGRGGSWGEWRRTAIPTVWNAQRRDTTPCLYAGSIDPVDVWGGDGGRVYSTAIVSSTSAMLTTCYPPGK